MVEDGVVAGRLTCVRSEYGDSDETTGHGRRQDYRHAALPRATNTVVLPGPDRAEPLREPPAGGLLYVAALSAGEINLARGQFCFSAAESLLLSPGVPPRPLQDVNIFGDAREALARLAGIGDDPAGDNASCGKSGQSVQIGLYSPTMRFDDLEWRC
jgi:TldD protein